MNKAKSATVGLLAVVSVAATMVLSAGVAEAHHCRQSNEVGNLTIDGGAVVVGVDSNTSATTQGVYVCADPPHQEQDVSVDIGTSAGLGTASALASVSTCGSFGCGPLVFPTGATASVPSASLDEPLDGDNVMGASADMGGGVCPSVNGISPGCQLGGTVGHYTAGGDPATPPIHPSVDPFIGYMYYTAQYGLVDYEQWCAGLLFQGYHLDAWAVWCATVAYQQFVVGPLATLPLP